MHRDFKIGLVVALALLLLIIVYFYVSGDEFEAPQEGAAPTASEARPPVGAVEVEGEEANEVEWTGELATAADVTADGQKGVAARHEGGGDLPRELRMAAQRRGEMCTVGRDSLEVAARLVVAEAGQLGQGIDHRVACVNQCLGLTKDVRR